MGPSEGGLSECRLQFVNSQQQERHYTIRARHAETKMEAVIRVSIRRGRLVATGLPATP